MPGAIDTHVHLWDHFSRWNPSVGSTDETFTVQELGRGMAETRVDRVILVQAESSVAETEQLLRTAAASPVVAGVVGWVDVAQPDVEDAIARLREGEGGDHLRGVRIELGLDGPAANEFANAIRGSRAAAACGLAVDILTTSRDLTTVVALAKEVPEARLVLDHFAYPADDPDEVIAWQAALAMLVPVENVVFKLSAFPPASRDHAAYAIALAGLERVMFGSDWPLCLRFGSYGEVVAVAQELVEPSWRDRVFLANACRVYRLAEEARQNPSIAPPAP